MKKSNSELFPNRTKYVNITGNSSREQIQRIQWLFQNTHNIESRLKFNSFTKKRLFPAGLEGKTRLICLSNLRKSFVCLGLEPTYSVSNNLRIRTLQNLPNFGKSPLLAMGFACRKFVIARFGY